MRGRTPMTIETDGAALAADTNRVNWREAPHSHWSFHNIDKVLRTTTIAASGEVAPLPAAPMSLDDFDLRLSNGSSLSLQAFLGATTTDAIVILKDGSLVFERYGHGMAADQTHILMSCTKAMTGLLAGALVGRGLLHMDAPVTRYVPEMEGAAYRGATMRDLLDMRTGVLLDGAQRIAYDSISQADDSVPGFHGLIQGLSGAQGPHGRPFSYISSNTDLAGWAMERATGRSFADLFGELIWRPLGAGHNAQIILDKDGSPWCSGGLCITARDFARIGQLVLDGGLRAGREIIPPAWIADLYSGGSREAWADGEWGPAFAFLGAPIGYRSGWYSVHGAPPVLFAMGVYGQNLFIDPQNRLVIAKFSSQTRFDYPVVTMTHAAVPEFRRVVMGR
jgi:CubicO group peptidase (beta-lactamase class C family)